MAVVANDLAFFRDHSVAALGAGVKKGRGFVGVFIRPLRLSKIQEGWKAFNVDIGVLRMLVHVFRLT